MDSRIEIHRLLQPFCSCGGCCAGCATAIPDAPNLISRNDLGKETGRDVSHFDKARVKEEDVRPVHGHTLGGALPFDRSRRAARRSMFVHVDAEFYGHLSTRLDGRNDGLTIITQQELVFDAEHTHWFTRFATFRQPLMTIVAKRNRNTLEAGDRNVSKNAPWTSVSQRTQ